MDIYYENQKLASELDKFPLFAPKECHHNYQWVNDSNIKDKPTQFGEMMEYKYGDDAIEKSMQIVISCPVCCKSWCD